MSLHRENARLRRRIMANATESDAAASSIAKISEALAEASFELKRLHAENAALKREAHTWSKAAEHYAKPLEPLDPLDVEELWDVANADPYADEVHHEFARLIQRKLGIGG